MAIGVPLTGTQAHTAPQQQVKHGLQDFYFPCNESPLRPSSTNFVDVQHVKMKLSPGLSETKNDLSSKT